MGNCCDCLDENIVLPKGDTGEKGDTGDDGNNGNDGLNAPQWSVGSGTPYAHTSDPAFYINTDDYSIWEFSSGSWTKITVGYGPWITVGSGGSSYYGSYSADPISPLKFRLEGYNLRLFGKLCNNTPAAVTVSTDIFTFGIGYKPLKAVKVVLPDTTTPALVICEIATTGVVTLRGDLVQWAHTGLTGFYNTTVYFDITFPIN